MTQMSDHVTGKPLSGKSVLLSLLGFFAVVIGMNILMARSALDSFDGQVERDAYRKGLSFNEKIDRARQEAALGWRAEVMQVGSTLKITLQESQSLPILGASPSAQLWHKTADGMDADLPLERTGPGQFEGDISNVPAGRWQLRLVVTRGDDAVRFRRDIMVTKDKANG